MCRSTSLDVAHTVVQPRHVHRYFNRSSFYHKQNKKIFLKIDNIWLDFVCLFASVVVVVVLLLLLDTNTTTKMKVTAILCWDFQPKATLLKPANKAGSFHFKIIKNLLLWPRNRSGQEHRLMNISFWLTTKVGGKNSYYVFSLCMTGNRIYICKLTPITHLWACGYRSLATSQYSPS